MSCFALASVGKKIRASTNTYAYTGPSPDTTLTSTTKISLASLMSIPFGKKMKKLLLNYKHTRTERTNCPATPPHTIFYLFFQSYTPLRASGMGNGQWGDTHEHIYPTLVPHLSCAKVELEEGRRRRRQTLSLL